jgi:uncharacterized protein
MKLIKVQGKGNISSPPDTATLAFEIEARSRDYAQCLQHLNTRAEDLRQSVAAGSAERAVLKTTAFNVSVETQYQDGRHLHVGYIASHCLQIEMPMDTPLLNRVFRQVAGGRSGAQVKITFSVKDKDALRRRVLADAVRVAKANAALLAEAAGVRLGPLQQIEYGWSEIRLQERQANVLCEAAPMTSNYQPDIQPEDVTADDNVTLVYAIED